MRECLQKNGIPVPAPSSGNGRPAGGFFGALAGGTTAQGSDAGPAAGRVQEVWRWTLRGRRRPRLSPREQPRFQAGTRDLRRLPASERRERATPEYGRQRPGVQHKGDQHGQPTVQEHDRQVALDLPINSHTSRASRHWLGSRAITSQREPVRRQARRHLLRARLLQSQRPAPPRSRRRRAAPPNRRRRLRSHGSFPR